MKLYNFWLRKNELKTRQNQYLYKKTSNDILPSIKACNAVARSIPFAMKKRGNHLKIHFRTFNPETTDQVKESESNITFKVPKSDWKPKLKPVRRRSNDYLTRRNCFNFIDTIALRVSQRLFQSTSVQELWVFKVRSKNWWYTLKVNW